MPHSKIFTATVSIDSFEGITTEDVQKAIEEHFFTEGELFDIKGTDAIIIEIDITD